MKKNEAHIAFDGVDTSFEDYELSLKLALQQANEAQVVKQRFLSIISHEILTPITSIITLSSLLSSTNTPQEQEEFISEIDSSAHDLWEIFNNMMDYAMLWSSPHQLDEDFFDLRDIVGHAIDTVSPKAHQKNIELLVDIAQDIPYRMGGDATLLQKVLEKLLYNAIKYSDKGTVSIKAMVDHRHSLPNGIGLHMEVVDQGIGIPVSLQAEIFDRFATSNAFHQKRQGGTGLGLTLCKQIVTILGGTMGVKSVEGSGSTFWCDIPFKEAASKETVVTLKPLRILFVDSVHPLKFQWVAKLIHWGMDVDVVRDVSPQSLKDITQKDYDCVLIRAADVELAEHYKSNLKLLKNPTFRVVPYVMIQMPPHAQPSAQHDWLAVLRTPLHDDDVSAILSRVGKAIARG